MIVVSLLAVVLLTIIGIIGFLYLKIGHDGNTLLKKLVTLERLTSDAGRKVKAKSENIICQECGAAVPGNFKFCNKCGTVLEAKRKPKVLVSRPCPGCGSSVPGEFNFCNKCGVPIEETEVKK